MRPNSCSIQAPTWRVDRGKLAATQTFKLSSCAALIKPALPPISKLVRPSIPPCSKSLRQPRIVSSSSNNALATSRQLHPSSKSTRAFARRVIRLAAAPSRANAISLLRSSSPRKPPRIMPPSESDQQRNARNFPEPSMSRGIHGCRASCHLSLNIDNDLVRLIHDPLVLSIYYPGYQMRDKLFAAISILIGLVLALAVGEVICRFFPVSDGLMAMPVNASAPIFHFTPNRNVTWSRDWNFSIVNRVHVNNVGYVNDQDYDVNDPRPLLAVVGDSYVEAAMVPPKDTLQGRLAKALAPAIRVYSFAASGAPL